MITDELKTRHDGFEDGMTHLLKVVQASTIAGEAGLVMVFPDGRVTLCDGKTRFESIEDAVSWFGEQI